MMNAKKKKEKDIKRGFMTNEERKQIEVQKREDRNKRKHRNKYKKSLIDD